MGQNFIACNRDQSFLLPPDVREWLPENHFAWFVIDMVARMDLSAFYGAYRADGHGRAAFDPAMVVSVLLYAYARGTRSSRAIERACEDDVACRVIAANEVPDHTALARFRQRHQDALSGVFGEVLELCADAGLVNVSVIAVDGTKLHANASEQATCDYDQIARDVLAEAAAVDIEEDAVHGERRGDELPEYLATGSGRERWLMDAKRRLEQRRARQERPIPGPRLARLRDAKRRLEEELQAEVDANADYEAYRARRGDAQRATAGGSLAAEALHPARLAPGQGQRHRPGLAQRQDRTRLGAGLQRSGRHHRAPDRDRGRAHKLLSGLRPDRPDDRRRAPRTRWRRRPRDATDSARRRRLLAPGPDARACRRRPAGPRPARRQETQGNQTRLGRRALRVHAKSLVDADRREPLRQAQHDDRAGLRPDEVQPQDRPFPTPRKSRRGFPQQPPWNAAVWMLARSRDAVAAAAGSFRVVVFGGGDEPESPSWRTWMHRNAPE